MEELFVTYISVGQKILLCFTGEFMVKFSMQLFLATSIECICSIDFMCYQCLTSCNLQFSRMRELPQCSNMVEIHSDILIYVFDFYFYASFIFQLTLQFYFSRIEELNLVFFKSYGPILVLVWEVGLQSNHCVVLEGERGDVQAKRERGEQLQRYLLGGSNQMSQTRTQLLIGTGDVARASMH